MVLNKVLQVYDRVLNMTRVLNMPVLHVENAPSYMFNRLLSIRRVRLC